MCFSVPKKIVKIEKGLALTETGSWANLGMVKAMPGDYLLVYGNMAVEKVSKKKAGHFRVVLSKS